MTYPEYFMAMFILNPVFILSIVLILTIHIIKQKTNIEFRTKYLSIFGLFLLFIAWVISREFWDFQIGNQLMTIIDKQNQE